MHRKRTEDLVILTLVKTGLSDCSCIIVMHFCDAVHEGPWGLLEPRVVLSVRHMSANLDGTEQKGFWKSE